MIGKYKATGVFTLLASALVFAACSGPVATTPTVDANMIYTQAAQTVQAQLATSAALTPSATNTVAPTMTPIPSTPTVAVTIASITAVPTSTPTFSVADKATWVSNNPADGSQVNPGAEFPVTWTVKNDGQTTWNTKFSFRYYAGDKMGASNISFPKEVKPGESVDLTVTMRAPGNSGEYNSIWVMTNDQGANFYSLNIRIKVGTGPTSTATSNGSSTATATSTAAAEATATATAAPTSVPTSIAPSATP